MAFVAGQGQVGSGSVVFVVLRGLDDETQRGLDALGRLCECARSLKTS